MKLNALEKMVVPVKKEILTLADEMHGVCYFESSCYLKDRKMLLKAGPSSKYKINLIMCISLGMKFSKCNKIHVLSLFFLFKNNCEIFLFCFS
jgi:hypothetical protein